MQYLFVLCALLSLSASLPAEELVRTVPLAADPLIVSSVPGKQLQPLLEIADPGISSPVYALKGMIRYEDVEGEGFLQLDNHFGETGTFFTKSLAPTGPLGKITGSSDWRPFVLPFYTNSGDQADSPSLLPEKLSLAVYLPGSGTVSLREVALYQYASGEDPLRQAGQWFGDRSAGLIGGIGGSLLGVWGALVGFLSSRGKARRFVIGSASGILVFGIAGIVAGVAALAAAQPYAVWFPLLLFGIIVVAVIGKLRGSLSARYAQVELKRMQSMDA